MAGSSTSIPLCVNVVKFDDSQTLVHHHLIKQCDNKNILCEGLMNTADASKLYPLLNQDPYSLCQAQGRLSSTSHGICLQHLKYQPCKKYENTSKSKMHVKSKDKNC